MVVWFDGVWFDGVLGGWGIWRIFGLRTLLGVGSFGVGGAVRVGVGMRGWIF